MRFSILLLLKIVFLILFQHVWCYEIVNVSSDFDPLFEFLQEFSDLTSAVLPHGDDILTKVDHFDMIDQSIENLLQKCENHNHKSLNNNNLYQLDITRIYSIIINNYQERNDNNILVDESNSISLDHSAIIKKLQLIKDQLSKYQTELWKSIIIKQKTCKTASSDKIANNCIMTLSRNQSAEIYSSRINFIRRTVNLFQLIATKEPCSLKCNNRGNCLFDFHGKPSCMCQETYYGDDCQFIKCKGFGNGYYFPDEPGQCGGHGACDTTSGSCKCNIPYEPDQCECPIPAVDIKHTIKPTKSRMVTFPKNPTKFSIEMFFKTNVQESTDKNKNKSYELCRQRDKLRGGYKINMAGGLIRFSYSYVNNGVYGKFGSSWYHQKKINDDISHHIVVSVNGKVITIVVDGWAMSWESLIPLGFIENSRVRTLHIWRGEGVDNKIGFPGTMYYLRVYDYIVNAMELFIHCKKANCASKDDSHNSDGSCVWSGITDVPDGKRCKINAHCKGRICFKEKCRGPFQKNEQGCEHSTQCILSTFCHKRFCRDPSEIPPICAVVKVTSIATSLFPETTDSMICIDDRLLKLQARGLHVIIIDPLELEEAYVKFFDTNTSLKYSDDAADLINLQIEGRWIVIVCSGECVRARSLRLVSAMKNIGAKDFHLLNPGQSYVFIGERRPFGRTFERSSTDNNPVIIGEQVCGDANSINGIPISTTSTDDNWEITVGHGSEYIFNRQIDGDMPGMNVVTLNNSKHQINYYNFEIDVSYEDSEELATLLTAVEEGWWILMSCSYDCTESKTSNLVSGMNIIGAYGFDKLKLNSPYLLIVYLGPNGYSREISNSREMHGIGLDVCSGPETHAMILDSQTKAITGGIQHWDIQIGNQRRYNRKKYGLSSGLNFVKVSTADLKTSKWKQYNTHTSAAEADALAKDIMNTPPGWWMGITCSDDCMTYTSEKLSIAMKAIGSNLYQNLGINASFVFFGLKVTPIMTPYSREKASLSGDRIDLQGWMCGYGREWVGQYIGDCYNVSTMSRGKIPNFQGDWILNVGDVNRWDRFKNGINPGFNVAFIDWTTGAVGYKYYKTNESEDDSNMLANDIGSIREGNAIVMVCSEDCVSKRTLALVGAIRGMGGHKFSDLKVGESYILTSERFPNGQRQHEYIDVHTKSGVRNLAINSQDFICKEVINGPEILLLSQGLYNVKSGFNWEINIDNVSSSTFNKNKQGSQTGLNMVVIDVPDKLQTFVTWRSFDTSKTSLDVLEAIKFIEAARLIEGQWLVIVCSEDCTGKRTDSLIKTIQNLSGLANYTQFSTLKYQSSYAAIAYVGPGAYIREVVREADKVDMSGVAVRVCSWANVAIYSNGKSSDIKPIKWSITATVSVVVGGKIEPKTRLEWNVKTKGNNFGFNAVYIVPSAMEEEGPGATFFTYNIVTNKESSTSLIEHINNMNIDDWILITCSNDCLALVTTDLVDVMKQNFGATQITELKSGGSYVMMGKKSSKGVDKYEREIVNNTGPATLTGRVCEFK